MKERIRQQAAQQLIMVTDLSQDRVRRICDEVAPTCKLFGSYSLQLARENPYEDEIGYFRLYEIWGPGRIVKVVSFRLVTLPADHPTNPHAPKDKAFTTFVATEIVELVSRKVKAGGLVPIRPEQVAPGYKGYLRFTNGVADRASSEDPRVTVRMLPR